MQEINFLKRTILSAYKKCIKGKQKNTLIKENSVFTVDYVTNCDLETEKYIVSQIKKKYPNDTIISEEYNSNNELGGRCWILDPIDGTVCFSNNIPAWCIQSAFTIDGVCKFAIIYCPTINEMYIADENGLTINGKTVEYEINKPIEQSIINVGDFVQKNLEAYSLQFEILKKIGLKCHKIKIFGSAGYEFCMVASGRSQAYMFIGNNIWDIMPGSFICEKVGYDIIKSECNGLKITIACTKNFKSALQDIIKTT